MKKRNFNPKNYNVLNRLRNKVVNDLSNIIDLNNKKILEVGCGSGILSNLLGKKFNDSYIYGIDIVKSYIDSCDKKYSNVKFEVNDINNIDNTYDSIFLFFALTELLKTKDIKTILNDLNNNILINGYLVLIEEFEDDYEENNDLLGVEIMKTLGYKYMTFKDFKKNIDNSNFEIIFTKLYDNKQKKVDIHGAKLQIYYENKLNEFDNSIKYTSEDIWNKYEEKIINNDGFRTYNRSRVIVLKKKDNIEEKLNNVKSDLCLYYSKNKIIDNIKYYKDLNILNLEFVFPIKTFPDKKIIDIFDKYNFNFDVSHEDEYELIKNYNKNIYYSDPTEILKNKDSYRLNIEGIISHFGKEYDNKSHEIFHIHISDNKDSIIRDKVLKELKKLDYSKTKYLDIGGSYDKLSYYELYSFISDIRNIIPNNIIILLEAGSIWFKKSGYLISKVKNITNIRNTKFIFINASRDLHAKWSIPNYINNHKGNNDYIVCGSTCYEKDLFAHIYNASINKEDRLYFSDIEPYSYSFNSSFNGVEKAEVIIDE